MNPPRKPRPARGTISLKARPAMIAFLRKYLAVAEREICQCHTMLPSDPTPRTKGQLEYWKHAAAVIRWLVSNVGVIKSLNLPSDQGE